VLVDPQGSRKFAANAPAQLVTAVCFDELYHEIFNELEAEPVYEALWQWLDARF
jgi:alpha-beta hydrolase superfamily lysophospholipase